VAIINKPGYNYPWVSAFIRPLFLLVTIRLLRDDFLKFILVIKDSIPMLLFILVYIIYFAWIGLRLFEGTVEGVQYFGSFADAFWNMLVLITTSNFPDIMLPAYDTSRGYACFFVLYLVVGLFLFMNLLLATFYSNFKVRF